MELRPFRGFYDMQSEMNRMFDEIFGARARPPGESGTLPRPPRMDVLEEEGNLVIRADLPGVKLEDLDVKVQGRTLTISGERTAEEEEHGGYIVRERRPASFRRSLILPGGMEEDKIHARFHDGVLEITLPGAVAEAPRRIQIEGQGGEDLGD